MSHLLRMGALGLALLLCTGIASADPNEHASPTGHEASSGAADEGAQTSTTSGSGGNMTGPGPGCRPYCYDETF